MIRKLRLLITDILRISVSVCNFMSSGKQASRLTLNSIPMSALSNYHRGDKGIRTLDPLLARQVLSQLSYTPIGALGAS